MLHLFLICIYIYIRIYVYIFLHMLDVIHSVFVWLIFDRHDNTYHILVLSNNVIGAIPILVMHSLFLFLGVIPNNRCCTFFLYVYIYIYVYTYIFSYICWMSYLMDWFGLYLNGTIIPTIYWYYRTML